MKSTIEHSLHVQVEKWLARGSTTPVHVIEFSRTPSTRRRYVCVEIAQPAGSRAMFFFRHDDGCWRVFPPEPARQKMNVEYLSV